MLNNSSTAPWVLQFSLLEKITDGFSEERKVGSGGNGEVYMGKQDNGEEIAVKKLYPRPGLDDKQFMNEFSNLIKVQHENIVRLVGYCYDEQDERVQHNGKLVLAQREYRMLCFEYLHGGSLDKHLYEEHCGLDWHTRYKIIKGICEGLNYLHGLKESILHLDLKPANILLDKNMVPKIADFGLSRLFGETRTHITENCIGTRRYMPPEFILECKITKKYDVFSLGVIIIEIMTGREGYSKYHETSTSEQFIELVHNKWKDRIEATSIHTSPEEDCKQVKRCIEIALNCVEAERHKRPTIGDIIHKLRETETTRHKVSMSFSQEPESVSSHFKRMKFSPRMETTEEKRGRQGGEDEEKLIVTVEMEMVVTVSTGAMKALLPKLAEMVKDEYDLHRGVKEGIKYVQKELESMQAALEKVSEALPDQLDPQVKLWARDLREMSYDIEDTIDSYRARVDAGDESESSKSWYTNIKRIKRKVDELSKRRDKYKIDSIVAPHKSDSRWLARYQDEQKLVGIDHLREKIIALLSMEGQGPSEQKPKLISIVGPGGMGKTTLASVVYKKLEEKFDCAAFVSVSLNPNMKDILTSILRQIRHQKYENAPVDQEKDDTDSIKHVPKAKDKSINRQDSERNYEAWSEPEVMEKIIEVLKDKRYLIVIDDIWDESAWDHIKCVFTENNCGSKIITTTRIKRVAEYSCSSDIVDGITHELQPLSDFDSRKLLYYKVFRQDMCPPEFERVSKKILESCEGLPLAIVTVASLLTSKRLDQWQSIYDSIHTGLESSHRVRDMQGVLSLSYYDLPHELKACLLYLSMFPEDSIIGRDDLIWRWAAEGFIHATQEKLYEVGEGYFNELINRSMIQQAHVDTHGRAQACRVHDLVLEFITKLSTEENFVTTLNRQRLPSQPNSIRRLSLRNCRDEHGVPQNITSLPHVRSLVVFSEAFESIPSLSNFRVLRVLDLELWSSNAIMGVGELLHLRYFRLSHKYFNYIELPEEIGNLQFLQTLDLKGARIEQLPSTVAKIRGLRVLEVSLGEWGKTHEKSLLECLCNLEKLEDLYIFAPDVSLDFMLDVSLACRYLRRFTACVRRQTEHIFRPSSVWKEFSPFSRLPGWLDSSLSNLSDLSIIVKILQRQGLETLAHLPLLLSLDLQVVEATKERLAITGSTYQAIAFPYLENFKYASRAMGLVFRRGAMQRLRRLSLSFDVAETKDVHGDFDFGLENLNSLEAVDVGIDCRCARDWEVMAAEVALCNATNLNPNHPTLNVSRHFEKEMLWDGKQEIPEGTIRKQEEIRLTKIGPWGGNGGRARDIEVAPRRLESVKIWSGWVINSLEFSYSDHDGQQHTAGPWGHPAEDMSQIQLGPSEFVTRVSGTVGPLGPISSILTSVTFHTNVKRYGPFGRSAGTPFATSVKNNGSAIVGFFARAGINVDAIGVYVHPL